MTPAYQPPEPLAEHHDLAGIACRSIEQTDWQRRYARQSAGTGTTKVLVVTEHDSEQVIAYYAWCMAQIDLVGLSDRIGCRGLLVHAESEQARDFYRHLIPEFEPSPTDPLHLILLMKDIRRTLRRGRDQPLTAAAWWQPASSLRNRIQPARWNGDIM